MMLFLVRYGEVFLKSEPVRKRFEDQLIANIKSAIPRARIERRRGRIIIEAEDGSALSKIFGIVSYSPVQAVEPKISTMEKAVVSFVKKGKTFALRVNRPNKKFPLTSQEIAMKLGSAVVKATGNKVDLSNPETEVFVEVFEDVAFLFTETVKGPGGLPLGVSGRLLLLNKDQDSERAGWMMMKRGCTLDVLGKQTPLIEQWSIGHEVRYVEGSLDENMKNYPALVTGDKEVPTEYKGYPVFTPLLGL